MFRLLVCQNHNRCSEGFYICDVRLGFDHGRILNLAFLLEPVVLGVSFLNMVIDITLVVSIRLIQKPHILPMLISA